MLKLFVKHCVVLPAFAAVCWGTTGLVAAEVPTPARVLKHTADKVGRGFKDRRAGFGRLNLADGMRLLEHRLN